MALGVITTLSLAWGLCVVNPYGNRPGIGGLYSSPQHNFEGNFSTRRSIGMTEYRALSASFDEMKPLQWNECVEISPIPDSQPIAPNAG